jgi:hypothetical protein
MLKEKFIRIRSEPKPRCLSLGVSGNPLWPLEELRNLRNPPFVADPEFTPFAIDALGREAKGSSGVG